MGSFRTIGPRREIKAAFASLQWQRKSNEFSISGKCYFKTSSGHNKRHIRYPREDRILPLEDNVGILLLKRGLRFNVEESQNEHPIGVVLLR